MPEIRDGFTSLPQGMHDSLHPTLVPADRASRAINVAFRGGYAKTRPGWTLEVDLGVKGAKPFQGGGRWRSPVGEFIVAVFNGVAHFYNLGSGAVTSLVSVLSPGKQVFSTEAGELFVMGDGDRTVAFQIVGGVPALVYPLAGQDKTNTMVPASIMHYCNGRIHYVPTNLGLSPTSSFSYSKYFMSGDILKPGDPLSVLGTTETSTLDGGLARGLPDELGPIRGLVSAQNPGKGLGIGPLYVFARDGLAAFDVSVPRESIVDANGTVQQPGWVGSAIGSVMEYGTGTESPWSLVGTGKDVYFRAQDGIYSIARDTQSAQAGAVDPATVSYEVQRWINPETQLAGISGVAVDQRILMTAISDGADGYLGILSFDSALSNTLGVDSPSGWDGIWTGPRFAKLVGADKRGEQTLFAILTDGTIFRMDETSDTDAGTAIESQLISRAMYSAPELRGQYKKLNYVDLWLSNITCNTSVKVYFRPDGYPLWTQIGCDRTLAVGVDSLPQERRRLRFACRDVGHENDPRPGMNSGSLRFGYTYQIKIVFTGCATISRMDCLSVAVPEEAPLQANFDSAAQNFAIIPNDFHTADIDFAQPPPGPGLAAGFSNGSQPLGVDVGVGVPSAAWPPAYTRQVYPTPVPAAESTTVGGGGGGGGASGSGGSKLTVVGDSSQGGSSSKSIVATTSGGGSTGAKTVVSLYGVGSGVAFGPTDMLLAFNSGTPPYVVGGRSLAASAVGGLQAGQVLKYDGTKLVMDFVLPVGANEGDILVWSAAESKWVVAPGMVVG